MKKDPTVPTPPVPDPLDRLLRQTLADARPDGDADLARRSASGAEAAPHIDAERLAAWAAKSLSGEEMAEIDRHLSSCDRCQAMLAVFARIEPAPAPSPSLWQRWRLAWVIPATAAAAATLTWIAWPGRVPATPPPAAVVAQSEAPNRVVVAPEPTIGLRPADAQSAAQQAQAALQQEQQGQQGQTTKMADARQANRAEVPPTTAKPAPPTPTEPPARPQAAPLPATPPAQAVAAPPPPPPPPPVMPPVTVAGGAPVVPSILAEAIASSTVIFTFTSGDPATKDVQTSTAVAGGAAGAMGGGGGGGGRGGGRAATPPAATFRASVDVPVRWRILSTGLVERSVDNGATWSTIVLNLEPTARVTSGAAPSPAVCWLVGRAGLVLLTTDGVRFERVRVPDTTDLSSIRATNARQASITTADGRVLVTADGGATWK
jgi:hypothetical protein